jgi:type 1 glutamine amidotransferase
MKKIVAIVGDYYHRAEDSQAALNKSLQPLLESGEISLRYITTEQLKSTLAERPDAVILFAEDRTAPQEDENARWMTTEISTLIAKYVEAGGGWLAWHSGLASYDPEGQYVGMLRGYFLRHPSEHQRVRYTSVAQGADGTRGAQSFEILDEHYFVTCQTEGIEVFLRSDSIDGSSIAAWRHVYGNGRVCCLTPAHRPEGLLHPEVLKLLNEAIGWISSS